MENHLECPCCGVIGATAADGLFYDGQLLECGCEGAVSVCPEDGAYINGDCPCGDPELLRSSWVTHRRALEFIAERYPEPRHANHPDECPDIELCDGCVARTALEGNASVIARLLQLEAE